MPLFIVESLWLHGLIKKGPNFWTLSDFPFPPGLDALRKLFWSSHVNLANLADRNDITYNLCQRTRSKFIFHGIILLRRKHLHMKSSANFTSRAIWFPLFRQRPKIGSTLYPITSIVKLQKYWFNRLPTYRQMHCLFINCTCTAFIY